MSTLPPPPYNGDYDPQNEAQFRRQVEVVLAGLENKIPTDPVITSIVATFFKDGSAKVTVTGNPYVKSIKCAISTTAYPLTATVNAATPTDGSSADFSFTGPYALGDTVYLSALGYSGAAGSGNASDKKDVKVVVSVIQSTLLVTIDQTASTGFSDPSAATYPTVTLAVTITDPAGLLTGNALMTVATNGIQAAYNNTLAHTLVTENWTIGTTYTVTVTLNKALKGGGYVRFTASKSGGYSGSNTFWTSSAWADAPADIVITIASNTSSSDSTAKASLTVNSADNVDSMKWVASTSSQPTKATCVASGTSVSVGPPFSVSDLGVNLAFGDTVYVTVVFYDYDGVLMDKVFYAKATRSNLSKTKTLQWAAAGHFTPINVDKVGSGFVGLSGAINIDRSVDELFYNAVGPGSGVGFVVALKAKASMSFVLADGGTVTAMSAEVWGDSVTSGGGHFTSVRLTIYLYAVALGSNVIDSAAIASVSDTATGAYQTVTQSGISQSTTSKRFVAVAYFVSAEQWNLDNIYGKFRSFTVTYLPSDPQATV